VSFLLDTNVISEIRKGSRCDRNVARWYSGTAGNELFVSVLVFGEIRKGIELARSRDKPQADALAKWLDDLKSVFSDRVILLTAEIADMWGRLNAVRPLPVVDSLLAATAKIHGLTLVTRDIKALSGLDLDLLDPFKAR
jgi:predicted nucleic acid-binding protein